MKARPFLAVLLAAVLVLLGLGLAGWWLVWQRSPLQLAHHPLEVPRAARFVPRQAPLSLYLFSDGEQPVGYARAVAPPRQRRQAAAAVERLRDGAFAAAGLDYHDELAGWLAPGIALALFDGLPPSPSAPSVPADASAETTAPAPVPGGWLLALSSRDDDGARRFLQRFWQTRSLAGTDLQVTSYRGMGLISGRGALVGQQPVPLATALIDDDLVLIASGRGVLEQALDVSQIDELNQASLPRLTRALQRFGQGAGLLLARPAALSPWLGLPLPPAPADRPGSLVAVLRPDGAALRLEGLLEAPESLGEALAPADPERLQPLLAAMAGNPTHLALLQDPAALGQVPLLRPLLAAAAVPAGAGPLPALVAAADDGPLLAADGPQGWLMGTEADRPDPGALEASLAAEGLTAAPLELRDRSALVWTRLESTSGRPARAAGAADQLQATVAGWRSLDEGLAWWGRSLGLLEKPRSGRGAAARERQLKALGLPLAPFRWALGPEPARSQLQAWRPWRLLSGLSGGGLADPVQGLALALAPEGGTLQLQARLEFGPETSR